MRQILQISTVMVFALILLSCGGGKKMSVEDYNRLTPQERIAYLQERIQKNPDDAMLHKQLSEEYLKMGEDQQAMTALEKYLALDPYQTDVQFQYGELSYRTGNYKAAYRAFLTVMQSSSADLYMRRVEGYVGGNYITQQLTFSDVDEGYPSFSPDGKKIAYQKRVGDNWDIYEFDLESKNETALVTSVADDELPVYSPDGSGIVYASTMSDRRPVDPKFKYREIARMDVNDRYIATLTRSFADDWLPRFSRSGEEIVFVSDRDDLRRVSYVMKQSDVYLMESDGDFQQQLTKMPSNEGGATFSANDENIFFHSDRTGKYNIMVMRRDGSKQMTIVDSPGNDVNPSCSPDGKHIVFVSDRNGNYEIFRSGIDGSNQEQLTFHPGVDANPVYSPDGRSIVFHSNRTGNFNIFLLTFTESAGETTVASIVEKLQQLAN